MGGGKGGSKVQVTQYSMSIHFGLCFAVDAITGITYGQKQIWNGRVEDNTVVNISNPNLFGGDKKEGGVSGRAFMLLGKSNQILPDELAQRLGMPDGVSTPAYRGIASIFFTGYGGATGPRGSGHLSGITTSPIFSAFFGGGGSGSGFVWTSNTPYLRDVWTTVERYPKQLNTALAKIPRGGAQGIPASKPDWKYLVLDVADLTDYSSPTLNDSSWLRGAAPFASGEMDSATAYGFSSTPGTLVPQQKRVWLRTKLFLDSVPDSFPFDAFVDNGITVWVNGKKVIEDYDSYDHHYSTTIPGSNFFAGENDIAVLGVDDNAGVRPNNHFYFDLRSVVGTTSDYDANPAHIIFECLTNQEWGMGESTDNIDVDSFNAVASQLYDEGFGLSMMWSAESTIEDFVNEVLGHINGVLFTNPRTGKFTLRLSRGDYDIDTLPVIDPDHATMVSFSRKAWGETINEVKVTWTNPINEGEETITLQDNGNIAMQGAIVSSSTNYYGIRTAALAARVTARDLRSASSPLCTAEMVLDRTLWFLAPMDAVKVTWPEYGLNELVMRVTSIDYGSLGDGGITVSLIEDVFSLSPAAYSSPPSSGWQNPTFPPSAVTSPLTMPAPYFGLAEAINGDPSGLADPDTYETTLAAPPTPGASSYDLAVQVTAPSGDQSWSTIRFARPFVNYGELVGTLAEEVTSFFPAVENAAIVGYPEVNHLVVIGGPDTPDEEREFAFVSEFDAVENNYVLIRGAFDTTIRAWPAGTPVWYGEADAFLADPTVRVDGATTKYRLLTNTNVGQLSIDDAPDVSAVAKTRASKPLRPANVKVNGQGFGTITPTSLIVSVTWANRNRLAEDVQVLKWDDASVPGEDKQNTTISCRRVSDGVVLGTATGITGESFSFDMLMMVTEADGPVVLSVGSKRGDEYSWSAHGITVDTSAITAADWARTPPEIPQEQPDQYVLDGGGA